MNPDFAYMPINLTDLRFNFQHMNQMFVPPIKAPCSIHHSRSNLNQHRSKSYRSCTTEFKMHLHLSH